MTDPDDGQGDRCGIGGDHRLNSAGTIQPDGGSVKQSDGTERDDGTSCPECGNGPEGLLFDPRVHPEKDRLKCSECGHQWPVEKAVGQKEVDAL